jgi:3-hydroxypropanoate dehydrogenase
MNSAILDARTGVRDHTVREVFDAGRSFGAWLDTPVAPHLLRQAYELAAKGPTSMNCQPMRVKFVSSAAAKERLLPALAAANVEKARRAPVVAILGYDLAFYELLPRVFPHRPEAKNAYIADPRLAEETAFRNASLQCA